MKQGLSWTGGPAEVDLRPPAGAGPEATAAARAELEAFRSDCHEQYMAMPSSSSSTLCGNTVADVRSHVYSTSKATMFDARSWETFAPCKTPSFTRDGECGRRTGRR